MTGSRPLENLRVIEFAGIGPTQFAGMMLSDLGADVIRVERPQVTSVTSQDELLNRGRRSITIDLRLEEGRKAALQLVQGQDVLLEGFRPNVMERLGLGPDACWELNRRLVYVRVTGWGQDGPLRRSVGHDINYLAMSGALSSIRRAGELPVPPLNFLADFGAGGMLAIVGALAGVLEAQRTGQGSVIDAAMVDGCALLQTSIFQLQASGTWNGQPGTNIIDTGAPFYDVYECADGQCLAVGAIEPQFYSALLEGLGLVDELQGSQMNEAEWPAMKQRFRDTFIAKTRPEWLTIFDAGDACVSPVLTMNEATAHPALLARGTFVENERGVVQPSPAPRFNGTAPTLNGLPPVPGEHTNEILFEFGFSWSEVARLHKDGVVG